MSKYDFDRIIRDSAPSYYTELVETDELISAFARMQAQICDDINDALDQFFVNTATWGLDLWEQMCGIVLNNLKKTTFDLLEDTETTLGVMEGQTWTELESMYTETPLEDRRGIILSKIRGPGTITAEKLRQVAASFQYGDVEVVEYPSDYIVLINFVNEIGVPAADDAMQKQLREIIPAHISIEFSNTYIRWFELDAYNWTFDDLDGAGLTWDQFETLPPIY